MPRRKSESPNDSENAGSAGATAFIQHVRLAGRAHGLVKNLGGFSKKHHSVPDFASAAAVAFLGKLCADELAVEAEAFFQKARAAFAYKRKDISLDVSSPAAVLTSRHFTLEWNYALNEDDPAEWTLTRTLHTLDFSHENAEPAFEELFAGMFDSIVFALTKGARVEDVIDAVESFDTGEDWTNPAPLTVTYPSDCATCTLRVDGVPAEVVFSGGELSMVFPRAGSPRELIEAFAAARHAFALTRHPALMALL
ncbi:hypothetical protein [Ereboglobus luteus]|uniref:Uncharacterized protein n=1 Tax=Ereboglobus luteus TaxID=1796921 RepID=A0A2U8E7B8_9BACT|nr:hypothetical protein [Ereboglobus luteus]AWI10492.1 hypothetical protein CKA38_03550 [Ereboglobus luteus]